MASVTLGEGSTLQGGKYHIVKVLGQGGLGRKRTDLLIRKPLTDHYGGPVQRIVLELKILRRGLDVCRQ